MKYAAIIRDAKNVIIRVAERATKERARKAGEFYTKLPGWWYTVAEGEDVIDMFKGLINA